MNLNHFFFSQEEIYEILYKVLIGVWMDSHFIFPILDPVFFREGIIYYYLTKCSTSRGIEEQLNMTFFLGPKERNAFHP